MAVRSRKLQETILKMEATMKTYNGNKMLVLCTATLFITGSFPATSIGEETREVRSRLVFQSLHSKKKNFADANKSSTKPLLKIDGREITYNGYVLKIGMDVEFLRQAVGGMPRCTTHYGGPISCAWDDLGIEVLTNEKKMVRYIHFYLNVEPPNSDAGLMTHGSDGSPSMPRDVPLPPKSPFPGELRLDGYQIHPDTTYGEVKAQAPMRRYACSFSSCHMPSTLINGATQMYLTLVGYGDSSAIWTLALEKSE